MIRFRRKVYEKLLESLGESINSIGMKINSELENPVVINTTDDIERALASLYVFEGDIVKDLADNEEPLSNLGIYHYNGNIYSFGLGEGTDYDINKSRKLIYTYNIKTNTWSHREGEFYRSRYSPLTVEDNMVYCYPNNSTYYPLISYNLDTGEYKEIMEFAPRNYKDITQYRGVCSIMGKYGNKIYFSVGSFNNFATVDLVTKTFAIKKLSASKIHCYKKDKIYTYISGRVSKIDIETGTSENIIKIKIENLENPEILNMFFISEDTLLLVGINIIYLVDITKKTYSVRNIILSADRTSYYHSNSSVSVCVVGRCVYFKVYQTTSSVSPITYRGRFLKYYI